MRVHENFQPKSSCYLNTLLQSLLTLTWHFRNIAITPISPVNMTLNFRCYQSHTTLVLIIYQIVSPYRLGKELKCSFVYLPIYFINNDCLLIKQNNSIINRLVQSSAPRHPQFYEGSVEEAVMFTPAVTECSEVHLFSGRDWFPSSTLRFTS